MTGQDERWADGAAYEAYVGRWSRLAAREFLSWLGEAPGRRWLDLGCGTGALSAVILAAAQPSAVIGVDRSDGFISFARRQLGDRRAHFLVGDGQSLPIADGAVDVAVSGLVLNFLPDPDHAAAEMARVVRTGGIVAAYVWDYAGRMELMRYFWDAAAALDPAARALDEGRRFPLCQPAALHALFTRAGLRVIDVRAIEVPTVFRDFADYWTPFQGGQGPAPGYLVALPPERQSALRTLVRERLPVRPDGSIHLVARAWAVRGER